MPWSTRLLAVHLPGYVTEGFYTRTRNLLSPVEISANTYASPWIAARAAGLTAAGLVVGALLGGALEVRALGPLACEII